MFRLLGLALSAVLLAGAQGPFRFELKRMEKRAGACVTTFEYPEILSAASLVARDRINAGILRMLLRGSGWPAADSGARSLESYANAFMSECAEFQKRPEAHPQYEHKRVTIFRYTPPVLSFRCDASEDAGGAHPFGTTLFVNFDGRTGKTLAIADVIREGSLGELEALAEKLFRQNARLSPAGSLAENGYSFPGNRFKLNENFGLGETELVFFFNTYEIGPGVMGPTEIRIPFQLLRGQLRDGFNAW